MGILGFTNKSNQIEIVEDSETFILNKNLKKRDVGNYNSTIKKVIDMTIDKEKLEAEIEKKKAEKDPNMKDQFQIKNIKNFHLCSENFDKNIYNFGHCPMLYGLYNCYGCHEPISLSPDDFWIMIIQSFSVYVLRNSDILKNKFVNFEGKKQLIINLNEQFEFLSKEKFEKIFNNFNEQISEYVGKELIDNLQADFSTTTVTEKAVSQLGIMTALQNFFEYKVYLIGCGFPSITLRGTVEDYEKILKKIEFLKDYNLEWWLNLLKPIITKIIETKKCLNENRKNEIDFEFWKGMIKKETKEKKVEEGSQVKKYQTDFISGWIVYFFPFNKKGGRRDEIGRLKIKSELEFLIETDCKEIPGEIQSVPILIKDITINKDFNCNIYNGFFGFERDNNQRMKPIIGWFLAE